MNTLPTTITLPENEMNVWKCQMCKKDNVWIVCLRQSITQSKYLNNSDKVIVTFIYLLFLYLFFPGQGVQLQFYFSTYTY